MPCQPTEAIMTETNQGVSVKGEVEVHLFALARA